MRHQFKHVEMRGHVTQFIMKFRCTTGVDLIFNPLHRICISIQPCDVVKNEPTISDADRRWRGREREVRSVVKVTSSRMVSLSRSTHTVIERRSHNRYNRQTRMFLDSVPMTTAKTVVENISDDALQTLMKTFLKSLDPVLLKAAQQGLTNLPFTDEQLNRSLTSSVHDVAPRFVDERSNTRNDPLFVSFPFLLVRNC